MYKNCRNCGNPITVYNTKISGFCCYPCYEQWHKWNMEPNCECAICGAKFYLRPSKIKRVKTAITCSEECKKIQKSIVMKGEGNHQYGLKGPLNASFKGEEITRINHNIVDIRVYCPNHPRRDKDNRVTKHRLIVEQNYKKFDPIYFEEVNGMMVLKETLNGMPIEVHHIDFNHDNNDINNLIPLLKSEHKTIHNLHKRLRNNLHEKITGVVKGGELLENPEVDNQQLSLDGNIFESSETNSRVLIEDSNTDTSALHNENYDDIVRTTDITINETVELENKESLR